MKAVVLNTFRAKQGLFHNVKIMVEVDRLGVRWYTETSILIDVDVEKVNAALGGFQTRPSELGGYSILLPSMQEEPFLGRANANSRPNAEFNEAVIKAYMEWINVTDFSDISSFITAL